MSEVPEGSWDSPYLENFAPDADADPPIRDGSSGPANGGGGGSAGRDETADVHAWYTRGMELLGQGSPAAAAQVLERAANAEPGSPSVREALARAQFDTGQYKAAAANFAAIVEASPTDDYAQFGLGLALARCGEHEAAAEHLALAAAMYPDRRHYTEALTQVRATLKSRKGRQSPLQAHAAIAELGGQSPIPRSFARPVPFRDRKECGFGNDGAGPDPPGIHHHPGPGRPSR